MTCNKGALNPVHAADVDQFMPAWVHRAAPCVRASLHLVAKVGHFAPLLFRRFASLRYSFADLLRSYLWAASLRSDLLRTCFAPGSHLLRICVQALLGFFSSHSSSRVAVSLIWGQTGCLFIKIKVSCREPPLWGQLCVDSEHTALRQGRPTRR